MPQSIIERQQPKYGQGSIRGLTSGEKTKLRRQNIKDAGKGVLNTVYNYGTDLPTRLAKIPAAAIDQIAGTDIQGTMDGIQSMPSQALRNGASNTKAFDQGGKVAEGLLGMATLLGAGRMGGGLKPAATNKKVRVETTENPKPSAGFVSKKLSNPKTNNIDYLKLLDEAKNDSLARELGYKNAADMEKTIRAEANAEALADAKSLRAENDSNYISNQEMIQAAKGRKENPINSNTSRARAAKLKNNNRSKAERTLLKKTERDTQQAINAVNNQSLEDMFNEWKSQQNS